MRKEGARGAGYVSNTNMPRRYLSNMDMIYKPIVEEAIEKSGRIDICIDSEPMPGIQSDYQSEQSYSELRETMIGRFFSIYLDEYLCMKDDCSDFWNMFRQVEQSEKWAVYLKLVRD